MKYIILALIILIVYYYSTYKYASVVVTNPTVRAWNVIGGYKNSAAAATLLSETNATMIEFMRYLKKKYHISETDDIIAAEGPAHAKIINTPNDIYNIVNHLLENYNPDVFYENYPIFTNDTTYTNNKGASMYICLRNKPNPDLVDKNTLIFVLLHEMSHIANYRGWSHENDFWMVFKFILHEAVLAGIYSPAEYQKFPVRYCGIVVAY